MTTSDLPTLDAAQSAVVAQVQRTVCEGSSRDRPLSERERAKLATIVEMTAMRRVRLGLPFDAADLHAGAMTTIEALASSEADFLARPVGSRVGALLARQSDVLEEDDALETGLAEQRHRLERDPSLVSPTWAVYAVKPNEIEFWQPDEERRHTRLRYRRVTGRKDG